MAGTMVPRADARLYHICGACTSEILVPILLHLKESRSGERIVQEPEKPVVCLVVSFQLAIVIERTI